jgi:hypothetical protein
MCYIFYTINKSRVKSSEQMLHSHNNICFQCLHFKVGEKSNYTSNSKKKKNSILYCHHNDVLCLMDASKSYFNTALYSITLF